MKEIIYHRRREMEPLPGRAYATVYIQQTRQQRADTQQWLTEIAAEILSVAERDADVASWFIRPMRRFPHDRPGSHYTPDEILTDMLAQITAGRDLTEAMIGRWNRLTEGTPWAVNLVREQDKTPVPRLNKRFFE